MPASTRPVIVCALYRFVQLDDYRRLQAPLQQLLEEQAIAGSLLLAPEGINGTVAGSRAAIDTLLAWLRSDVRFAGLAGRESCTDRLPFRHVRVQLKQEIDTRNDYEVRVGSFRNAVNPHTRSFRDFPRYVRDHLDPARHRKVAMYCTGGIRCEKSTALLRELGFARVFHLRGGILGYLEQVPPQDSLWEGECFVFDERVTLDHRLQPGSYRLCHACRMPLAPADLQHPAYLPGIRCPHCSGLHSPQRQQRFAEREKQMQLARSRGAAHLGSAARQTMER